MKKKKVWLITGASKGIGFELTKKVLSAGEQVVAAVRNKPEELIGQFGDKSNLLVVEMDVTDEKQILAGVSKGGEKFGSIDVLVNNAGYAMVGAIEEASDAEAKAQFETNVFGLLNVTRAVLPVMRAQKSGHIINISSFYAYGIQYPGLGLFSATKYAVEGITEGLALEVNPLGIKVTVVAPGTFRTDFAATSSYKAAAVVIADYEQTSGYFRKYIDKFNHSQPGDPAKLAGVMLKLADSDNPPLHLPVGADSLESFKSFAQKNAQAIAPWEEIISTTNF